MCIITFIIFLLLIYFLLFNKREGYEEHFILLESDPNRGIEGMKDRFIDPMKRRYINQIDFYRDAPNINLERALSRPTLTTDDIDWSKVSDSEYPILINYLSGRNDATKIKSINAI
jgi:hypothetical protein